MITAIRQLVETSLWAVAQAAEVLAYSAIWFAGLALLIKGREAFAAARRTATEVRANLLLHLANIVVFAPAVGIAVTILRAVVKRYSLELLDQRTWAHLGRPGILVAVIFVGDFLAYWRHRAQHTRWLWPAHAIHHSDTHMTWVTIVRFHPIDNFTTDCFDFGCLALLGFPDWALVANAIVRNYYGQFIHADLPWTYGPAAGVFVSPVMHRWHHARDVTGAGSNFATMFSLFDRVFRTYHVPGLCTVPLGVTDNVGESTLQRLAYPLIAWADSVRSGLAAHLPPRRGAGDRRSRES